jgi:penicillin-binding protein 1C
LKRALQGTGKGLRGLAHWLAGTGSRAQDTFRRSPVLFLVLFFCLGFLLFLYWPPRQDLLKGASPPVIYSAEGVELRQFRDVSSGTYRTWRMLGDFPRELVTFLLISEDSRYNLHFGVDPVAVLRAAKQNLEAGRVVSGASTLPMQLSRVVYTGYMPEGDLLRKPVEALLALRLKALFSNRELLEAYLNRVPLPENSSGFASASRRVLGKDIRYLTETESAALVVLLRGMPPGEKVLARRIETLMERVSPGEKDGQKEKESASSEIRSVASVIMESRNRSSSLEHHRSAAAPHFIDYLRQVQPGLTGRFYSTISSGLTAEVSSIVRNELGMVEKFEAGNAAVVILEHLPEEGRVALRVLLGSRDYSDPETGQVNGALARRTAGSTLKPFVYALAMEREGLTPWSLLEDEEVAVTATPSGDTYRALNYDLNYWGQMTLREALATSRNLPPVTLIDRLGVQSFHDFLIKTGMDLPAKGPEEFGPGMILGTAGVSPLDLARAYTLFMTGGELLPLFLGRDETGRDLERGTKRALVSKRTAFWITDILSDGDVRRKAFGNRSFLDFPFDVAAKTGTSKDFRDSWTVGYTERYVVAVWVGNFNNDPMNDVSGVYGAGRIMQQVMRLLAGEQRPRFMVPDNYRSVLICPISGGEARDDCPAREEWLAPGMPVPKTCPGHDSLDMAEGYSSPRIDSPSDGEVFYFDPHTPRSAQAVPLQVRDCRGCRLFVDGSFYREVEGDLRDALELSPGNHRLTLRWDGGSKTVEFRLE